MNLQSMRDNLPFANRTLVTSRDHDEATAHLNQALAEPRKVTPVRARARADIHFTLETLPQIKLFGARWGDAISVRSAPLSGWHGILPLQGAVSCRRGGQTATSGELLLFAPGHDIDITWHNNTRAIVLSVDTSLLQAHAYTHHQHGLSGVFERVVCIPSTHCALISLGHLLYLIDAEARNDRGLLAGPAGQQHIQSLLCESLLQLLPDLPVSCEHRILPGMVKRVVDYIHGHLDQPQDVDIMGALVRVSNVSRRSLETAFRNTLQTSPMRYLQQCRLQAARDCLSQHQPGEIQLTDIAFRFGFSQPSHFTRAYKQAFGELPSQTLARCS